MAITSCSAFVYSAFLSDELAKGFFHGHTYSANPIACSAALAGIELLNSKEIQDRIEKIIEAHKAFGIKIQGHPNVKEIRQLGVIFALDLNIQMERYGNLRYQLFDFFMDRGVCLRPLGNTIYVLAPFIISNDELDKIYETIEEALDAF